MLQTLHLIVAYLRCIIFIKDNNNTDLLQTIQICAFQNVSGFLLKMEGEILFDLEEGEIPDYDLSSLRSPVKNDDTDVDFRNENNLEKEPFNQVTLDKCRGISGQVLISNKK